MMFKPLDGFNQQYVIDEDGNIYRKLTPNQHPQGYLRLGLRVNRKRKHFDIDGDKTNNRVENLEWRNHSENMLHAFRTGLKSPSHPKPVRQYTLDEYSSREGASRSVKACGCNINKAIQRNTVCAGYLWRRGEANA